MKTFNVFRLCVGGTLKRLIVHYYKYKTKIQTFKLFVSPAHAKPMLGKVLSYDIVCRLKQSCPPLDKKTISWICSSVSCLVSCHYADMLSDEIWVKWMNYSSYCLNGFGWFLFFGLWILNYSWLLETERSLRWREQNKQYIGELDKT